MQAGYAASPMKILSTKGRVSWKPRWGTSCIKMSRSCSVWEGWHWDDNKGGWLDWELCAKARCVEVEYIRRHKMYVRVPREVCLRETAKAPIKDGVGRDRPGAAREA